MTMKFTVDNITYFPGWCDFIPDHYIKEGNLRIALFGSLLTITWLDNAHKKGLTCPHLRISSDSPHKLGTLLRERYSTIVDLMADIAKTGIGDWAKNNKEFNVDLESLSGSSVFSPYALSVFKPLSAVPSKWTMAHAKRALANEQFKDLKCTGVYTDDYAHDNAVNFERNKQLTHTMLLDKLITSPSGWRTTFNEETLEVGIHCHHFDNNKFTLVLP